MLVGPSDLRRFWAVLALQRLYLFSDNSDVDPADACDLKDAQAVKVADDARPFGGSRADPTSIVSLGEFGRRALQAPCTELPVGNFGRHVCCGKSPLVSWIWGLGNSPGPLARSSRSISSEGPKSSTLFWGSPPHVWCIFAWMSEL